MGHTKTSGEKRAGIQKYYKLIPIVLFIVLTFTLFQNFMKIKQAQMSIDEAKARVEKLKKEDADLQAENARVQSEAFIEQQLRDKLGLAKKGEIVLVLPDDETLKKLAPVIPTEASELPLPIWKKWLNLFK